MKQVETVKKKIGKTNFYIRPFGAFKAANLSGELASVLTPIFSALAPLISEKKEESLMDMDVKEAASAISNVSINGEQLEKLMKKLLLGGHIAVEVENEDGEKEGENLDEDLANELFCGEVQDMFILCFYVIQINFNGFFSRFASLSGKVKLGKVQNPRKII